MTGIKGKGGGFPKRLCTSTGCTCNCCDKRQDRHCGQHKDGCHKKCG